MTAEVPVRICRFPTLLEAHDAYKSGMQPPASGANFNATVEEAIAGDPGLLEPCTAPRLPNVAIASFGSAACRATCDLGMKLQAYMADSIDEAHRRGESYAEVTNSTNGIQPQ